MELGEVKSDLYALRQLYGLLQNLIINPENVCKSLDERALQVLKSLLDNATQELSATEMNKADHYYQSNVLNMQSNTTKPKRIIVEPAKPLIPNHNNNTNNVIIGRDQQMTIDHDFASSPTGFSTPTSLGFNDDDDDHHHDQRHGTFSKEVSNAIEQIDSYISALDPMQITSVRTRVSHPKLIKLLKDVDGSNRLVRGLRPTPSTNVYRNRPSSSTNNTDRRSRRRGGRRRVLGRPALLEHENRRPSENYSTEIESSYSTDDEAEEENSEMSPWEVTESGDDYGSSYDYDDHDHEYYDDDDDGIQSSDCSSNCSGRSSNDSSSYGTAKSGTNPRRRVEDCSERVTRISTLRRIKNKLGLIFHHHHHHHHHQYYHDHSPRRRGDSNWKPLRRMFHNNNNYKRERRGRSVMKRSGDHRARHGGGGGGDVGNFRALAEALTRHAGGGRKNPAAEMGGRINHGGVVKIGSYRRGRDREKTSTNHKLKI